MNLKNDQKEVLSKPIGIIHSPFKDRNEIPKQPYEGRDVKATVEIFPEFVDGLKCLEKFSHIVLLFNFHLSYDYNLQVVPYRKNHTSGVFATRSPHRPNQIGLSIVRLESIKSNIINITNIDIIDGTPLLDIKPFIKEMDCFDMID